MGALKALLSWAVAATGLALLAAGGVALALVYAPEAPGVPIAQGLLERALAVLLPQLGSEASPKEAIEILTGFPWRFAVAPLGLVMAVAALLPGRGSRADDDEEPSAADARPSREDRRGMKRAKKEAAKIARKGMPLEAAELCMACGLFDEAATYFLKANEIERAAEIRHDQNRFVESAELYARAGRHDAAGSIFAQQEEWARAAEAYVEAENLSVAAEMFEKADDPRRAAQCYQRCDFPRQAAKAFIRCELWSEAAECLEQVLAEEGQISPGDEARHAEYAKLVRMTGNLLERAGQRGRAIDVLARGGAFVPAAEMAQRAKQTDRAAELFLEGGEAQRAAEAFDSLGQTERAARILAELHRDRGELEDAAREFVRAGELLEAGDLYRACERFELAGEVYERFGDSGQAAEMFGLAGAPERAAANYERAGRFGEAAAIFERRGDVARQADLLEKGGECLAAGRIHLEAGRVDEAIGALQKVAAGHADFGPAAVLLGGIFRDREQYPVATAKLREALEGRDLDRDTIDLHFCLATVLEASGESAAALELYEKVLACDYQHADAAERLERMRAAVAAEARKAAEAEKAREAQAAAAASAAASPATPGESRYIIRGTLGRGGMGIVYKAEDTVLDRVVAFKVLPDSFKENEQALANFLREAKSAAQLNHPNIVTVYDAGEQDGVYYIAMEYVDGNTLKEIVKRKGRIAPRALVHVAAQLCEALAYAHDKKIVHRDVKTANAMWTVDRKAKIMDFGLAKVVEEVRNHTTVVSGTPFYMSPEQTLGKNVDPRTDLYSLGVSIFEMATGTLPFTEGNLPYHHVHTPPPDPRERVEDLPAGLAELILRCLRKDPDERYGSAREILADLKALEL